MSKTQRILLTALGGLVLVIFILVMVAQQTREYGTEVTLEEHEFQQILFLLEGGNKEIQGGGVALFYPEKEDQLVSFFSSNYTIQGTPIGEIYSQEGAAGVAQRYATLLGNPLTGVVVIPESTLQPLVEATQPPVSIQRSVSVVVQGKNWEFGRGIYTPTVEEGMAILSSKDTIGDVAELRRTYTLAIYEALGEWSKSPNKELNKLLTKDVTLYSISPDNLMWLMSSYRPEEVRIVGNMGDGELWALRVATLFDAYNGLIASFPAYDLSVPVDVLNGSGWPALASKTGRYLENSGFAIGEVGNALTPKGNVNYSHKTTDIAYYGGDEIKQTAMILGALIHCSDIQASTEFTEPKIVITLGADFNDQYYVNSNN